MEGKEKKGLLGKLKDAAEDQEGGDGEELCTRCVSNLCKTVQLHFLICAVEIKPKYFRESIAP